MSRFFEKRYWLNGSGYVASADAPIEFRFVKGNGADVFVQDRVDAEKQESAFAAVANDSSLTRAIHYYERFDKL